MHCIYINLDQAQERRHALEQSFQSHAPAHWSLERFAAVDTRAVAELGIEGVCHPGEIGCALSHLEIMQRMQDETQPFMIIEDDAQFGPNTCATIDKAIAHLEKTLAWDMLYADIGFTQIGVMSDFLGMRRQLLQAGRTRVIDPRGIAYFGTTAYLLHPRAIPKILSRYADQKRHDVPIDLVYRAMVNEGALTARFVFPFATTVAESGNESFVQGAGEARTDLIWNIYRRMVWRDGAVEPQLGRLADLSKDLSVESKAYAILWAAMADPGFKPK